MKKSSAVYRIIGVAVLAVLIVLVSILLIKSHSAKQQDIQQVAAGTQKLTQLEQVTVSQAESEIDAMLEQEKKEEEEQKKKEAEEKKKKEQVEKLSKKEIKTIFKKSVFVGDSLTEAISTYKFLSKSNVVYKRGMSVPNAGELFPTVVGLNPDQVFLSFGMNDLLYFRGKAESFIEAYQKQVSSLQDQLPDARIYIMSIMPIQDPALSKNQNFKHYGEFNKALKSMCDEMGLTFIDCTDLAEKHIDLYEPDGIHVKSTFYPYWFKTVAEKAGLL
ncbi:GDSL-type esterase/lipase family protein [Massiliimalia massiliensis]|uniref:GDSL-type esterase/lipase family protein n=1 Tax=Massiliimalia massiliensis TaxID=1852384 RepID=UPI000986FFD6|nr:GDSL-type esterase/lipase family protein [Massiliimalia massiliensis]